MKKIISMFSIVAMIISMMSTVAFASGNNLYWELVENESEGKVVTYNLVVDAADTLDKVSVAFDMADILSKGVTFKATNLCGGTFNDGSNAAKTISLTYQTAGSSFSGKVVLYKVAFDFSNATVDSVTVKLKNNRAATATYGTTSYTLTNTALTQELKPVAAGETLVENPYVFSFDADEETEVKITNSRTGDRTYSLPSFVKGGAKVNALLKIKADSDVQTGDKFTIDAIKGGKATTITTIEVK